MGAISEILERLKVTRVTHCKKLGNRLQTTYGETVTRVTPVTRPVRLVLKLQVDDRTITAIDCTSKSLDESLKKELYRWGPRLQAVWHQGQKIYGGES
ncbi:MAG: hypothetical protein CMK89_22340 [Pseudomonadales bacterium]|nr:hypothetical protein [Pseudomonadales bacterium]